MKKSAENVKNTRGDGIDRYLGDIKSRIDIFDNGYVLISSYTGSFEEYEKGIMLFRAENSAAIIDFIRNNFTANNPAYSGEHTANTLSETSGAYIPSGIAE